MDALITCIGMTGNVQWNTSIPTLCRLQGIGICLDDMPHCQLGRMKDACLVQRQYFRIAMGIEESHGIVPLLCLVGFGVTDGYDKFPILGGDGSK